ncbi:MAG: hypothetical protein KGH96_23680 [Sphingomonadales bacterium]|nr:hypothetical protein [Sphingomonadales bacterium]
MDAWLILRDGTKLRWDDVVGNTSEAQLHGWHFAVCNMSDDIKSQIEARTHSGEADPAWLRKASGKVAIGRTIMRLIDRRLTALGMQLPPDVERHERRLLYEMKAELRDARREIKRLKALVGTSDHEFEACHTVGDLTALVKRKEGM